MSSREYFCVFNGDLNVHTWSDRFQERQTIPSELKPNHIVRECLNRQVTANQCNTFRASKSKRLACYDLWLACVNRRLENSTLAHIRHSYLLALLASTWPDFIAPSYTRFHSHCHFDNPYRADFLLRAMSQKVRFVSHSSILPLVA